MSVDTTSDVSPEPFLGRIPREDQGTVHCTNALLPTLFPTSSFLSLVPLAK